MTEDLRGRIERVREQLFQVQTELKTAKGGGIIVTSSNSAPELAASKCIELCNYLLGNVQEFGIEFTPAVTDEANDEEDDEDFDEEYEEDDEDG